MIKYSLVCGNEHNFEGWFSSSNDFDSQKKRDLVRCPFCNTGNVSKNLMAPSVTTSKSKTNAPVEAKNNDANNSIVAANAELPERQKQLLEKMREVRSQLQENAEDVGSKFADEARKIHYGESEKRGIYGQASQQEVSSLIDEGVEVLPLPVLPEDSN